MAQPFQLELVECVDLQVDRRFACLGIGDEFGDHRIVEHRHFAAFGHAIIDANPLAFFRRVIAHKAADGREEAAIGIFGIDPVFNRPAGQHNIVLLEWQLFARSNADHLLDQINAGDILGHRMLDLEPGIHFKEIEALIGPDDQLDRPGTVIVHRSGQRDGLFAHGLAHLFIDKG